MSFLKNFHNVFDQSLNYFIKVKVKGTEQLKEAFKEKLELHLRNIGSDIFEHLEEMEAFSAKFGDAHSLLTFAVEVSYLIFSKIDQEFANVYISPFSATRYEQLKDQYIEFIHSANAPKFDQIENSDMSNPLATTFLLRQYAYDLPNRQEGKFEIEVGEIVLNCGACTGDSAIWFYQEGAKQVHNFEPVPDAFTQLQENLKLNNLPTEFSYPFAVGKQKGELQFVQPLNHIGASCQLEFAKEFNNSQATFCKDTTEGQLNSNQSNTKVIKAQCIVLDEWLEQQGIIPTYIKMDIEGAEPEALAGLTKTISTYKPKLAICLYHRPSDMWTIPQQILSMNQDYTFYCKKSATCAEFVLFAVPNKD